MAGSANAPLEKRTVEVISQATKKMESKSVLDPSLKVEGKFTTYKALPTLPKSEQNNGLYEECLARLKCINNDLRWLLGLPYARFWCQVIHDERLHRCLDTYLRYAPRYYDSDENLRSDEEIRDLHLEVHRRVFLTCLRMSTHKETKENFMSSTVFADIIYENFLFDIPMIMDLCVLYGRSNGPLLTKMVQNIFTHQKKYNQDLDGALMSVMQVFDTIAAQCDVSDEEVELPPKLDWVKSGSFSSQPDKVVADLVDYIFDVCHSLQAFLDIYPPALGACYSHNAFNKMAWFYHNVVPVIKSAILERDFQTIDCGDDVKGRVRGRLSQSRSVLIKLARKIIYQATIQKLLEGMGEDVGDYVEAYLQALTSMLNDRKFMSDYEARYPFSEDVEIITQTGYHIDETRLEYIREALAMPDSTKSKRSKSRRVNLKFNMSAAEAKKLRKRTVIKGPSGVSKPDVGVANRAGPERGVVNGYDDYGGASGGGGMNGYAEAMGADLETFGACAPAVSGVELESMISAVKDILPDLGEGFIERCLDEYNYDTSAVIDAVLTDSLRPNVCDVTRTLPRVVAPPGGELVSQRRNIYDGDEFDVFNRPDAVDLSRVTRGKKFLGEESTSMVLNDHTEVEEVREGYCKYATIDQFGEAFTPYEFAEVVLELTHDAVYDDEYDDTYDSADVGAMLDADEIEDFRTVASFKTQPLNEKKAPRRFHNTKDEEEEQETVRRNRDHFHEDPAAVRERREQRRVSQRGGNPAPPGTAPAAPAAPSGGEKKKYDVVGKAKGQGQDKSVLKNRNFKDKHKGRLANHNRRAQADKKMSKGMF